MLIALTTLKHCLYLHLYVVYLIFQTGPFQVALEGLAETLEAESLVLIWPDEEKDISDCFNFQLKQ